eukprot:s2894_g9.t1
MKLRWRWWSFVGELGNQEELQILFLSNPRSRWPWRNRRPLRRTSRLYSLSLLNFVDTLRDFEPLQVAPEVSFWQELSQRKLDIWRLDSSNVPFTAFYEASQASGVPAKCFLQKNAFDAAKVPAGAGKVIGELKNFNTEEEFRTFLGNAEARQSSLTEAVKSIRNDIDSGAALTEPSRLRRLILFSFADLKKYHYSFLSTLPALKTPKPWQRSKEPIEKLGQDVLAQVAKGLREADFDGLCLLLRSSSSETGWCLRPLADLPSLQVESEDDVVLVFVDPSSEDAPAWPLQNALLLLARYRPGQRLVLAFRDPQLASGARGYNSGGWNLAAGWPMALFGPWARLDTFGTIPDLLTHFNVSDEVWGGVIAQLGDPGNSLAILSAVPKSALVAACGTTVTPSGALTAIQATQVGLVWRLSRRVMAYRAGVNELDFVDDDPWQSSEQGGDNARPGRPGPQGTSGLKEQVLKMGSLIDQSDESELLPPAMDDVNRWFQNYIAVMGAAPDETEEPTSSQVAALAKRTLVNKQAPYVDFGIWVPFGRRMAKAQKAKVYTPLGDGTFLYQDVPGPASFQAWASSWKVFRCACVMLGVVSIAALENYYRHIEKLVTQYPQCWGLIMTADDTARAEA